MSQVEVVLHAVTQSHNPKNHMPDWSGRRIFAKVLCLIPAQRPTSGSFRRGTLGQFLVELGYSGHADRIFGSSETLEIVRIRLSSSCGVRKVVSRGDVRFSVIVVKVAIGRGRDIVGINFADVRRLSLPLGWRPM